MDLITDYDYHLPPELIAQTPLPNRSDSRLLVLHKETGEIEHRRFGDAPEYFQQGDVLVLNNTRVTARRVFGSLPTGGKVEALLMSEVDAGVFRALVRPARKLRVGVCFELAGRQAEVVAQEDEGVRLIRIALDCPLDSIGEIPLPPYIHQSLNDESSYQTVFAAEPGSSAAPTAGLHFTQEVLADLRCKSVLVEKITLDVGLDTFRPIGADSLDQHKMHGERCTIPPETVVALRARRGRVIAVGTTTVRTLESLADQIEDSHGPLSTSTELFIRPGYAFKVVDGMFTNFHLPRTTMLCMISAIAGRNHVLKAYETAVQERYRFLSFGDSMLII